MRTIELEGAALDWAVASTCFAPARIKIPAWATRPTILIYNNPKLPEAGGVYFHPSTDWAIGGPIIEREGIGLWKDIGTWIANKQGIAYEVKGDTPLISAMRCHVLCKLGEDVLVPFNV